MTDKHGITQLLIDWKDGSENAYKQLFPSIYSELKQLAHSELRRERRNHTFSSTDLVHEVYLKMIDQTRIQANDKNHFLAISARCMRQILIDHARKKKAEKRGGNKQNITYIDQLMKTQNQALNLLNIHEKLNQLAQLNNRLAQVVELRFFGKLTVQQTADVLSLSKSTVKRDWAKARGWLYKELK